MEYLYLISAPNHRFYFSIPIVVHIMHGYPSLQVMHQNFVLAEEYIHGTKASFFFTFLLTKCQKKMANLLLQFLTKMIVLFLKFGMAGGGRILKG